MRGLVRFCLLAAGLTWLAGGLFGQDVIADLETYSTPRSGMTCPSDELYSTVRPDPAGTPTTVGLAIFINDISTLSDVEQTMEADVYVIVRWRDSRLADPARGDRADECVPPPPDRFWRPAIEPENLRKIDEFYPHRFMVDARGVVTSVRRLFVKMAFPLDFKDFPFDHHRWMFTLWPVFSRSDEILFHPLERFNAAHDVLSIQGWNVGVPEATAGVSSRVARQGEYARFDMAVPLEREWSYYAWKLGLPLTLIVLMAYGVYLIPVANVAQQIGLGMTSMLTFIAYMLALGGGLPKISYLTRADQFFVGSAILVFLGLAKAVLTVGFPQSVDNRIWDRVNRFAIWVYPCGMVLNVINAFIL